MVDWDSARAQSRLLGGVTGFRRRLATATSESWLLDRFGAIQRTLDRAATNSRVGAAGRTVGRWVRGSWLYRWLTKEPDPDVIVIDLRETWTVGPVIAVIDRLAGGAEQVLRRSGLGGIGRGIEEAVRTAPVQILGIVAFVAVLVNTVAIAALGGLDDARLGVRLVLLAMATLATRIDASWDELRDGRVGSVCRAVLEPPQVPEASEEGTTTADRDDTAEEPDETPSDSDDSVSEQAKAATDPDVTDDTETEDTPTIEDIARIEDRDDR